MVLPIVQAWAQAYYYTTVGLPLPRALLIDDDEIVNTYKSLYQQPLEKLFGLSDEPVPPKNVSEIMSASQQVNIPGFLHILEFLVRHEYLKRPYYRISDQTSSMKPGLDVKSNEWVSSMKDCLDAISSDYTLSYAAVKGGKVFQCYTDKQMRPLGQYHQDVVVLGEVSKFSTGLNLSALARQSPIKISDYGITALRNAVKGGLISENELDSEMFHIPRDGQFVNTYVNATTPELPPYFVRQLITSLPAATVSDSENPYVAALQYAEEHPEDNRTALRDLRNIFAKMPVQAPKAPELNDDLVLEYIHEKYGQSVEELRSRLLVPTVNKLYTSQYLLDESCKNMTAQEFMDYASENPDAVSGTLDEIIQAFCKEEDFPTDQTVESLIRFIDGQEVEVVDIYDKLDKLCKENDIPMNLTLGEFITGSDDKKIQFDNAISTIKDSGLFDELFIKVITESFVQNKSTSYPTVEKVLRTINMPEQMRDGMIQSVITNSPYIPEQSEVTEKQVVDFLTRRGIPRVDAMDLAEGKFDQSQYLKESADVQASASTSAQPLEDGAYRASEFLLRSIRERIIENDSYELRETLLPIVYSFIRLLMLKSGDEDAAVEFLGEKKQESVSEVSGLIDKAIELLGSVE